MNLQRKLKNVTEIAPDVLSMLPKKNQVGIVGKWTLPVGHTSVDLDGKFLGVSTSFRHRHQGHPQSEFAKLNERCSACRWFEPRIFRESTGHKRFLIHRAGVSIVPGERIRTSYEWLISPFEVVEALTTRKAQTPQQCPICKGTRFVSFAPGTPGDIKDNTVMLSNSTNAYECETCNGEGIIYASAYLTPPAARVLAQAANFDHDLELAYVDRAVS